MTSVPLRQASEWRGTPPPWDLPFSFFFNVFQFCEAFNLPSFIFLFGESEIDKLEKFELIRIFWVWRLKIEDFLIPLCAHLQTFFKEKETRMQICKPSSRGGRPACKSANLLQEEGDQNMVWRRFEDVRKEVWENLQSSIFNLQTQKIRINSNIFNLSISESKKTKK